MHLKPEIAIGTELIEIGACAAIVAVTLVKEVNWNDHH
jgi:hypothetical protein